MRTKIALFFSLALGGVLGLRANNLNITGTSVAGSNITFQISWDNNWNANVAPNNWDAVWVFVKYQDCSTRLWNHAGLSTTSGDHTAASPLQVDAVTDGKGVFIRRSAFGGGNISSTSITLKMTIPAGTYNYKVFGIEMVSVPQGSFALGGPGSETKKYNNITVDAAAQAAGLSAASLGGSSVAIPNTFPMGYNAMYCMKYEITQLQYVDFLNTLTYVQQAQRTAFDPISVAGTHALGVSGAGNNNRNGIVISTPGANAATPAVYANDLTASIENNTDDGQNIAVNLLGFDDVYAYLDWAALRPMTEMEYEKICRGPMAAVSGEYAWGTTNLTQVYNSLPALVNDNMTTEIFTTVSNGRCAYGVNSTNVAYGPVRVGLFAEGSTGRESSGAAYYGVMEMSGNVWETCVTTGNTSGSVFTGTLGDGTLAVSGDANPVNWPTGNAGTAIKGSSYYEPSTNQLRTSDRTNNPYSLTTRAFWLGGRGVR